MANCSCIQGYMNVWTGLTISHWFDIKISFALRFRSQSNTYSLGAFWCLNWNTLEFDHQFRTRAIANVFNVTHSTQMRFYACLRTHSILYISLSTIPIRIHKQTQCSPFILRVRFHVSLMTHARSQFYAWVRIGSATWRANKS